MKTSPLVIAFALLVQSVFLMGAVITGTSGGSAGWPTVSTVKEVTWANSYANSARFGNGTSFWALYNDPTDGLQLIGVCNGVFNDCNYPRKLAASKYWEIQNSAGTSIFRITENTGAVTNLNLNCEGTGNTCTVTEEQWFDAAACQSTTAQAIFNLPTTNAPTPNCEGTNTRLATLDFNDTTAQSFSARWILPTGFVASAGIDIGLRWKAVSTSGATGWCVQLIPVPTGSTSDPAQQAKAAGNCISTTAQGTTLQETLSTISNVTCSSCAAGHAVNIVVSRDASGSVVTDSMTGDAKLMNWGRTWRVAK